MADDLLYAAVEMLDHAVSLWMTRPNKSMLDFMFSANFVEEVPACGFALPGGAKAIGKLLAVVGEDLGDLERCCLDEFLEKMPGRLG